MSFTYKDTTIAHEVKTYADLLTAVTALSAMFSDDEDLATFCVWLEQIPVSYEDDDDVEEEQPTASLIGGRFAEHYTNDEGVECTDCISLEVVGDSLDTHNGITQAFTDGNYCVYIIDHKIWVVSTVGLLLLHGGTKYHEHIYVPLWHPKFDMCAVVRGLMFLQGVCDFVYEITEYTVLLMKSDAPYRVADCVAGTIASPAHEEFAAKIKEGLKCVLEVSPTLELHVEANGISYLRNLTESSAQTVVYLL